MWFSAAGLSQDVLLSSKSSQQQASHKLHNGLASSDLNPHPNSQLH